MNNCRRILRVSLFFILLTTFCETSLATVVQQDDTLDEVVLQLKWKHQFQFAGYYAAIENGYYRDAGLQVIIRESPEDMSSSQPVLDGDAHFGVTGPDLLLMRYEGYPVVALAVIFQHSPMVLLAREDAGINSIHELAGKRIMMESPAAELLAYLQQEQIPRESFTEIPHTFNPDALIAGEVDAISAYISDEPFLMQQAGIDYFMFSPRASTIDFYGDLLYTTEDQIENHPDRVNAFIEASLRGWEYAMDNPDEIIDLIYTEYTQRHSPEHLEYEADWMQRLILSNIVDIGYMNPGRWQYMADTYASLGMLPEDFSIDEFLYSTDDETNTFEWILYPFLTVLLITGLVSFVAIRYYNLHKTTQNEITERLEIEDQIKALLKEKELLIHEVHHRIKNNISIVIGLLDLQSDTLKDEKAISALQDAGSRLLSMSVLYDKLYRSDNIRAISVQKYIPDLVHEIIRLYPTKTTIHQEIDVEDFELDANRLTPLGIIINEILTNSLKHAFHHTNECTIKVQTTLNNNRVTLTIQDSGPGLPEFVDFDSSTGFGMRLVKMLSEQLEGSIRIDGQNRSKYIVEFGL